MVKTTTDWEPDTCGCKIRYSFDDSLPQEEQVNSVQILNKNCPDHRHLLPNELIVYNTVLDEQSKKNNALEIALQTNPLKLADTVENEDGSTYVVLKPEIGYVWKFSNQAPNRTLDIAFLGATLTTVEKTEISSAINLRYGVDVVKVVDTVATDVVTKKG